MEQGNTYRTLKELSKSEYQVVGGEPNIIGWEVNNESGAYIGEIKELLFDPETQAVRYMVIDLSNNGMHLDDKQVMIPIGLAHLHVSNDEVVLPNIHIEQFNALPNYRSEETGPETEVFIRSVIGSPAALRIEESIIEFDQNAFYTHHHFNGDSLYQRGRSSEDMINLVSTQNPSAKRIEEEETIHQLIDRSQHQHSPDNEDSKNPATRGI